MIHCDEEQRTGGLKERRGWEEVERKRVWKERCMKSKEKRSEKVVGWRNGWVGHDSSDNLWLCVCWNSRYHIRSVTLCVCVFDQSCVTDVWSCEVCLVSAHSKQRLFFFVVVFCQVVWAAASPAGSFAPFPLGSKRILSHFKDSFWKFDDSLEEQRQSSDSYCCPAVSVAWWCCGVCSRAVWSWKTESQYMALHTRGKDIISDINWTDQTHSGWSWAVKHGL